MSTDLALGVVVLVLIATTLFTRYGPGVLLDSLDHVVMHLPRRWFLAMTPSRDPVVGPIVMAAATVAGFGIALVLAGRIGLWIIWPAAFLALILAIGFGVVFATMLWPVVLTAGFVVLRFVLGVLERAGGATTPFPADGPRISAFNITIALATLLSSYASALAIRARKAKAHNATPEPLRERFSRYRPGRRPGID